MHQPQRRRRPPSGECAARESCAQGWRRHRIDQMSHACSLRAPAPALRMARRRRAAGHLRESVSLLKTCEADLSEEACSSSRGFGVPAGASSQLHSFLAEARTTPARSCVRACHSIEPSGMITLRGVLHPASDRARQFQLYAALRMQQVACLQQLVAVMVWTRDASSGSRRPGEEDLARRGAGARLTPSLSPSARALHALAARLGRFLLSKPHRAAPSGRRTRQHTAAKRLHTRRISKHHTASAPPSRDCRTCDPAGCTSTPLARTRPGGVMGVMRREAMAPSRCAMAVLDDPRRMAI